MKDIFSDNSKGYAQYRPTYPKEVYEFILPLINSKQAAWDCATGNGQVAVVLSEYFVRVDATDISSKQMEQAIRRENIFYSVAPAEKTSFPGHHFDLVTVGQAVHWFQFDAFYKEVSRVLKPNGILAILGYDLFRMESSVQNIILDFYENKIGAYWDPERKYIDEKYKTIPFPFEEIPCPSLTHSYEWTLEQLLGLLETWSAVQHYIKAHKTNPVNELIPALQKVWKPGEKKKIEFPILMRVGRI